MKYINYMLIGMCFALFSVLYLSKKTAHMQYPHNCDQTAEYLRKQNKEELTEDDLYRNHVFKTNYRPIRNGAGINCTKIIQRDQKELSISSEIMQLSMFFKIKLSHYYYLNITKDCGLFLDSRGYIRHPLSDMELHFPLAFSILVYKDIEQAERLLRLIYRPHNFYCIHIDLKMSKTEKHALTNIAACFNNVFIAEKSVNVKWGTFSLIAAELACMKTLWPYKKWKYLINLTGQEFPLKTNRQIVAILRVLDGANVVQGSANLAKSVYKKRYSMMKTPPPGNLTLTKGSMHFAANRFYVDFCLHNPVSHQFQDWLKRTVIPDEFFFSTLNHNPHLGIRGSFLGKAEEYDLKPFFLRYTSWQFPYDEELIKYSCYGKFVREVCVLGVLDLYHAYKSDRLFANKFHLDFEYITLDCLEEALYGRTWKEYLENITIDTSYYRSLDYAKLQLKPRETSKDTH